MTGAQGRSTGIIASVIGVLTLLIGATTVLVELQSDLDRIWKAPPRGGHGVVLLLWAAVCFALLVVDWCCWAPNRLDADMASEQLLANLLAQEGGVMSTNWYYSTELRVLNTLASAGQSLYKLAADLRLLQSPPFGEWAEPFGKKQVGSSAMPFKRNPIHAENIDSLTRHLAALPRVAWDNAAHCYLERTLDDSANRRSILPEAFIILDESLGRATRILKGLRIDARAAGALLDQYGPFAATERVMMELARRGGDRQALHHTIREHSLAAWAALRDGGPNPVIERVCAEPEFLALASEDELRGWLDARGYVGDAPERARRLAQEVRDALETPQC